MSGGDEEEPSYNPIFERLVGLSGEDGIPHLEGLIAYGLYKTAKRERVAEFWQREDRTPSQAELDAYTTTWTQTQLDNLTARSRQVLSAFASSTLEAEEPRILRRALRGSFWRSVWPSMLGALLYTLLLIALAIVLNRAGIDIMGIFERSR